MIGSHLARATALGCAFLFNIVVARVLGARDAGDVLTAVLVTTLVAMAGRSGTDLVALRYAAFGRDHRAERLPWSSLTRRCVAGTVGLALVVAGASPALHALGRDGLAAVLPWTLLAAPVQSLAVLDSAVLRGRGATAVGAFMEVGLAQAVAIVAIVPLYAAGWATPVAVVLSYVAGSAVTAVVARVAALRRVGRLGVPDRVSARDQVALTAASVVSFLWVWTPALVAWAVLGPAQAALVIAALRYSTLIALVQTVQLNGLLPRVAGAWASGEVAGVNALLRRSYRAGLAVCAVAALLLAVAAGPLLALYGPEFPHAAGALRVLAVGALVGAAYGFLPPVLNVVGRPGLGLAVTAVTLVVGLPVVVVVTRLLGLTAGVAVVVAASAAMWAATDHLLRRRTGVRATLL